MQFNTDFVVERKPDCFLIAVAACVGPMRRVRPNRALQLDAREAGMDRADIPVLIPATESAMVAPGDAGCRGRC